MLRLLLVVILTFAPGLIRADTLGQQQAGAPALHLLKISAGPAGAERDGVFVLTEERAVFSRAEDKEVIVFFQWEGAPGPHKMVATWRSPDGGSSSTSTIDYDARDRRFGAYWRLLLAPHTPLGTWTIEATVDGLPGGRFTFEVTDAGAPPAPPVKRILTPRELYERLSRVHVVLERAVANGRALEPASALLGADGRLYTTAGVLDEADRIMAFTTDGSSRPIEHVLGWSRRGQWAVLAYGPETVESLEVAPLSNINVGDRCFSMDGTATGGRVLMEGSIIGQSTEADGPPRFVASFATGLARPGAPVVDESGAFLGVIAGTPNMMEMLRLQANLRGAPILPFSAFRLRAEAAPVPLSTLREKGELLAPVVGEEHVRSGGFSVAIQRGPIVAPTDQREEFHVTEKGFTVFVTWNPNERLRGMLTMSLFDADNRLVAQSKSVKRDFRKGDLLLTSWQQSMPRLPGRYRADVVMDDRVMWRGYVRVNK